MIETLLGGLLGGLGQLIEPLVGQAVEGCSRFVRIHRPSGVLVVPEFEGLPGEDRLRAKE